MSRPSSRVGSGKADAVVVVRDRLDCRRASVGPHVAPSLERELGLRLRAVRREKGLSIAMLGRKARVSVGTISKIENAQMSASLGTIQAIATALDVAFTSLFATVEPKQACIYVENGAGRLLKTKSAQAKHAHALLGTLRCRNLLIEPYLVDLAVDARTFSELRYRGTELVYVLEGEVVFRHADRDFHLDPGDCLLFDAAALHGPAGLGSTPVRYLSIAIHIQSSMVLEEG